MIVFAALLLSMMYGSYVIVEDSFEACEAKRESVQAQIDERAGKAGDLVYLGPCEKFELAAPKEHA